MSRAQRDKGRRGELEALHLLESYGIKAERIHGQEEIGGQSGDLKTAAGNIEVKRRAKIPAWLKPGPGVEAVMVREDGGGWLVVTRVGVVFGEPLTLGQLAIDLQGKGEGEDEGS